MVSLILLLLLTVIAITAASTSSLQSRMSANAQDMNLAFQAAESGLKRWIEMFESDPGLAIAGNLGTAVIEDPAVLEQAECLGGSLAPTGFTFTCYHITSTATAADGNAVAQHQMGYLVREGL